MPDVNYYLYTLYYDILIIEQSRVLVRISEKILIAFPKAEDTNINIKYKRMYDCMYI